MKISKQSWHYKLGNEHGTYAFQERCQDNAHTTCTYIRGVMNAMFSLTVVLTFLLVLLVFGIVVLSSMVAIPVAIAMGIPVLKGTLLGAMVAPCVLGWVVTALGLFGYVASFIIDKLESRHAAKVSLLKQARIDKKEGICTLVSFE